MTPLRYCFSTSLDLLVRGFDFLVAFLRHDHVVNADGHAGFRRLAETKLLELVEHDDGFFVAGKFVTFPNHVAEFGLLDRLVRKTKFRRPDFAENDAANGRLDDFFVGIAENGRLAEIRIRQTDAVVRFQRAIVVGETGLLPSCRTAANHLNSPARLCAARR